MAEEPEYDSDFPPADENGPSPPPPDFSALLASYPPPLPKCEGTEYDADFSSDAEDSRAGSPPPSSTSSTEPPSSPPGPEDLHYLVFKDSASEGDGTRAGSPPSPTSSAKSSSSPSEPEDLHCLVFEDSPSPTDSFGLEYRPQPPDPRPWTWRCHMCGTWYPLGVTRRCLTDGHYYCSGQRNFHTSRPKRRGKLCTSRFDYEGWEEMNSWRKHTHHVRFLLEEDKPIPLLGRPSCWEDCGSPSACCYFRYIRDKYPKPRPSGESDADLYQQEIAYPEKRKRLREATDGVSFLPPAKVSRLQRNPERASPPVKIKKAEEEPQRQIQPPPGVSVAPRSTPDEPILPKASSENKEFVEEESLAQEEASSTEGPAIKEEPLSDEEWPEPGA